MVPGRLATHAFGPRLQVERYRLDNGLGLLLLVDHSAPVASFQTWFAAGSRDEQAGKTGLAHLLEHLMFTETETLGVGEYDRRLEEAGADTNAATYLDWTYYLVNFPREALALVTALESERMQRLVLHDAEVACEREVVLNERRQTVDDDVDGSVAELLYREAFRCHPYRWPTIGLARDIARLDADDCRRFYRRFYAPANATVVLVGDVDRDHALGLLAEAYGGMRPSERPAPTPVTEPPQTAERRCVVVKPTATAKLAVGYRSAAIGDPDHAPLTLLVEILFGGRASRIYRSLVSDAELCSDAQGCVAGLRDPGLLEIHLTARAGRDAPALCAALDAELERLVRDPPTAGELERARARSELGTLTSMYTVSGKAEQIGFSELVLGDPAAMFTRLEAFGRVTCADLERVATCYLDRRARTVVEVSPGGEQASDASPAAGDRSTLGGAR